jgi:hypothetical protein
MGVHPLAHVGRKKIAETALFCEITPPNLLICQTHPKTFFESDKAFNGGPFG